MITQNRNPKKSKTALFEIRHQDSDKKIEMARSINITALKTGNRISGSSAQKRRMTETQGVLRNTKKQPKLSLNTACFEGFNLEEEMKKQMEMEQLLAHPSQKKIETFQTSQLIKKVDLLSMENNTANIDVDPLYPLCVELVRKIEELDKENQKSSDSLRKYEQYFKELSLIKQAQNQENDFLEENRKQKIEKNPQLKILNLERKIETLQYIIKNYRSNNKQEIKNFQKKINDFKPSLQSELEKMLAEANEKNKELQSLIHFYQTQCGDLAKNGNWENVISQLREKDSKISSLEQELEKINCTLLQSQEKLRQLSPIVEQNTALKEAYTKVKEDNKLIQLQMENAKQGKMAKQQEFCELSAELEELTFKYRGLLALEPKIKQKDDIISRNSSTILRLQSEIGSLRFKVRLAMKSSQNQLFHKETRVIENIENCINTIEELSSRFGEEIDNLAPGNELSSFMSHLYERTKQSFQKIVEEYKEHLNSSLIENKELKNRLDSMIICSKKKSQQADQILQEIQVIDEKRKRCVEAQNNIISLESCTGCKNWLLSSGQINNACEQLQSFLKKYMSIV